MRRWSNLDPIKFWERFGSPPGYKNRKKNDLDFPLYLLLSHLFLKKTYMSRWSYELWECSFQLCIQCFVFAFLCQTVDLLTPNRDSFLGYKAFLCISFLVFHFIFILNTFIQNLIVSSFFVTITTPATFKSEGFEFEGYR